MYNNQIETFIQVADSKSFSKASEKLLVSTVAVMKKINALEESIGAKLLDRTSHGVTLTAAGRSFYRDAQEMVKMAEGSIRRAREAARAEKYTIRIGCSQLHPYIAIHEKLSSLDLERLPFRIRMVPFHGEDMSISSKLKLLGREFDCFISPYSASGWADKVSILHLQDLPWRIAVPRGHRLAAKESVSPGELRGETLLFHERGVFSGFDALRDRLEAERPAIRLIDIPMYNTEAFNICAQKGFLIASLDIWTNIHPSLVPVPIEFDGSVPLGIIYDKEPSAGMLEFIGCLR